jgi:hypothetical protein
LKKENLEVSFYTRPSKRKGFDTDDDDDIYEPQSRLVHVNDGILFYYKLSIEKIILFRTSSHEILSNM